MSSTRFVPHRMALYANRIEMERTKNTRTSFRADYRHWYQTRWWRVIRRKWLELHPMCVMCDPPKPARVVDHKTPHRGDRRLFFNWFNLQSLCYYHHNSVKAAQEARPLSGAKLDGSPLIPSDGW